MRAAGMQVSSAGQPCRSCIFSCVSRAAARSLNWAVPAHFLGAGSLFAAPWQRQGWSQAVLSCRQAEAHCFPPQLTHMLAQCSGCADALAFRFPSSGTQLGIVKGPNWINLWMSLHEKYADSDEKISTPMQLPASVSPSIMSSLTFLRYQCSFSPASPPTQGFPQGWRGSSSSAASSSFVFFLKWWEFLTAALNAKRPSVPCSPASLPK